MRPASVGRSRLFMDCRDQLLLFAPVCPMFTPIINLKANMKAWRLSFKYCDLRQCKYGYKNTWMDQYLSVDLLLYGTVPHIQMDWTRLQVPLSNLRFLRDVNVVHTERDMLKWTAFNIKTKYWEVICNRNIVTKREMFT